MKYIYQNKDWNSFTWCGEKVLKLLSEVKLAQGFLLGKMNSLGFEIKNNALVKVLTENILKSSEIEGEILDSEQVRSSVARQLGLEVANNIPVERNIEGVVEMMLDATQNYNTLVDKERLIGWHAALFPTGFSGMYKINIGDYRNDSLGPMQVVSGSIGKEKMHYEAPPSNVLEKEMDDLICYINQIDDVDLLIKAGVIHLWFVILHPFDDGNGRIARALTDMILAKSDDLKFRFYSLSSQIRKERKSYYNILEKTQKGSLDITNWLLWFLENLLLSIKNSDEILRDVLAKAEFWQKHLSVEFNDRQRKILNKLFDGFDGNLTSTKWAKICNCSQDSANNDINDLINKKFLKKIGKAKNTHYIFVLSK